jgi:cytochrome P450
LLAEAPEQWAAVRSDPGLVPRAVEEALRFDPPVVEITKYTDGGTEVLDVEIPPRSMLWISVLAANHDPAAYADPDRFDVRRRHRRSQLNFGAGRHFCLGAALARMELAAMLGVIADQWATIEPAGPATVDRTYGAKVQALPIAVTAG